MRLAIVGATPDRSRAAGGNDGCYDVASLAKALAGKGHDVTLYTAAPPVHGGGSGDYRVVPLVPEAGLDGPPESLMPLIGDLGRQLVDEWSDQPPDVVHCHGWTYGMASQLAANRRPVPTVQSFHGLGTLMRTPGDAQDALDTRIKLQTLLAKNATTLAAACTDDLFELVRLGCPRSKISVVPAGVTVDENSVGMAPASRGHDDEVVAVASGPGHAERLTDVVRAMAVLAHTRLRIVDDRSDDPRNIERIVSLAADLGLGDRCRVVAVANDGELDAVLRSADVVVCPASYDAYGTVALRAMAAGTAVVGAAAGGVRDAIIPDVTGVLVPPANVLALRRALKSILAQPVLREGMGLAGRSRARSRYSWDRIAVDAEVAYHDAAMRHRGAERRAMA